MAAGAPDFGRHDDRGFQSGDVVPLAGHRVPPKLFDIAFQLRAEWAVIPKSVDAAVDFRGLKNESTPLAQRHNLFHQLITFRFGHKAGSLLQGESDVKEAGKLERAFVRWAHLEWVGLPLGRAGRRRRWAGPAGWDVP